ncbi:hypothetical protein FPQ18DRAFT_301385 [Pyronema domesticum]|nr:hypothetical protein FPQ18DRAFT_301385 [Pyronema domesticum]
MAQPPSQPPLQTSCKPAIDHSSTQHDNDNLSNSSPLSPSLDATDDAPVIPSNSTPDERYNKSQQLFTDGDASQPDLEFGIRRCEVVERIAFLEGVQHLQESTSTDSSSQPLDADNSSTPATSHPTESQDPVVESPVTMNLPSQPPSENKALVKMRSFLRHFQQKYPKFMQAIRETQHGKRSLTGVSALW